MSTTLNEQPPNPTVLQGLEQTPALEILTHADFSNFHNSGATIKIKTPLVKNSQEALFAVCTNGFVPNAALAGGVIGRMLANFFPLQPFPNSFSDEISNVYWENTTHPALFQYFSFRFNKGEANINIRLSSNTAQTGNFEIAQFSNVQRYFYTDKEKYTGLRFINVGNATKLTLPDGFALMDISLNRSLGIKPMNRFCLPGEDHWNKWLRVINLTNRQTEGSLDRFNEVSSQFLENWIVFTPLSSLPAEAGNEITVSLFYDWKEKMFMTPGLPVVPATFDGTYANRIVDFTATFKDREIIAVKDYSQLKYVGFKAPAVKGSNICSKLTPGSSTRIISEEDEQ